MRHYYQTGLFVPAPRGEDQVNLRSPFQNKSISANPASKKQHSYRIIYPQKNWISLPACLLHTTGLVEHHTSRIKTDRDIRCFIAKLPCPQPARTTANSIETATRKAGERQVKATWMPPNATGFYGELKIYTNPIRKNPTSTTAKTQLPDCHHLVPPRGIPYIS